MTYDHRWDSRLAVNPVHATLQAFPIACFSLTVLTDIAYWRTLNLLWLHFSEWLLLAGLVFGILAALARMVDGLVRRIRPSWPAAIGGLVVLLLAALNSFIHTADGWTAVVPYGLTVSALTVLAMIATGWLGRREARHV
ncbi:membrane protein [Allostella vacuolata]|nr:membrane protein [Stella vacuolata]